MSFQAANDAVGALDPSGNPDRAHPATKESHLRRQRRTPHRESTVWGVRHRCSALTRINHTHGVSSELGPESGPSGDCDAAGSTRIGIERRAVWSPQRSQPPDLHRNHRPDQLSVRCCDERRGVTGTAFRTGSGEGERNAAWVCTRHGERNVSHTMRSDATTTMGAVMG